MRLDQYLFKNKLCPSRTKAVEVIKATGVKVIFASGEERLIKTPSFKVSEDMTVQVESSDFIKFVARSGLKLEQALIDLSIDPMNFNCLDVGQSTGGFTDCLLQKGAKHIVGVDVGHEQLHSKLCEDPRVTFLEGVNARHLLEAPVPGSQSLFGELYFETFDFICLDLSFISLSYVFGQLPSLLKKNGEILALVKPQFELSPVEVPKGVVVDKSLYKKVELKIDQIITDLNFEKLNYIESTLPGRKGNIEFFVHCRLK